GVLDGLLGDGDARVQAAEVLGRLDAQFPHHGGAGAVLDDERRLVEEVEHGRREVGEPLLEQGVEPVALAAGHAPPPGRRTAPTRSPMRTPPWRRTHFSRPRAIFTPARGSAKDAAPICTALAPARIISAASSQFVTPPAPMMGAPRSFATARYTR